MAGLFQKLMTIALTTLLIITVWLLLGFAVARLLRFTNSEEDDREQERTLAAMQRLKERKRK